MPNPSTAPPRDALAPMHVDDELGPAALSSLRAHIAVLDRRGRIIAVNEARGLAAGVHGDSWRR